MSIWDEALVYSTALGHIRNPYRRLLMQNYEEIRMFLRRGGDYNYAVKMGRLVKPISLLETLFFPYVKLFSVLIFYLRRKMHYEAA